LVGEVKKKRERFFNFGGEENRKEKTEVKTPSGGYSKSRNGFWSNLIIAIIMGLYCLGGFSDILI